MSDGKTLKVLDAEALSKMSPAEMLAYAAAIAEAAKVAQGFIAEAKSKQTEQARKELEGSLRATLTFPTLTADTLASVKAAGAAGFVVVYDLETGAGTPSVTFKAKAAVKKDGTQRALPVQARDLKGLYETHATPEEKVEDSATIEKRVADAMAKGSFGGNEAKARNSISWSVVDARLHRKGL